MTRFYSLLAVNGICAVLAAPKGFVELSNGVLMPQISLGTGESKYDHNDTVLEEAIVAGAGLGLQGLDCAFNYYDQKAVGKAISAVGRKRLFITSKTSPCINNPHGIGPYYNITDVTACKAQTRKDVERDFSQLGVEKIDLLLLHGANHFGTGGCDKLACNLNRAQWEVYEEFYKAGRLRAVGLSNYCPSCIDCLLHDGAKFEVHPQVLQNKYHVGMTADPHGFVSYARSKGMLPMAYTPLGKGGALLKDSHLSTIARRHSKSTSQVALKWIVDKGYALATASKSPHHIAEDLDLFSWQLDSSEMAFLDTYSNSSDVPSWACTEEIKTKSLRSVAVVI
eukprot:TRINITY_DN63622_c0_g1_i1.p1 TRINITY_DN63622_c0_g1~~TRINITY_DN63622_c0_g1_i1.p1  ORF type:complete len:356 (+),score=58.52 TRINITY_DN63622_c0_g1_i1:57-1070(+)